MSRSGREQIVTARLVSLLPPKQRTTKRRTGLHEGGDQNRRFDYIRRESGHHSGSRTRHLTTRHTVTLRVQNPTPHPYQTPQNPTVAK